METDAEKGAELESLLALKPSLVEWKPATKTGGVPDTIYPLKPSLVEWKPAYRAMA